MSETGKRPLVSIIIPSFNHAAYVEQSIRAALAQTYTPVEVIVVDDCSTDGSRELLTRLATELPFTLLLNEENRRLNATVERGLEASRGDFISLVASDDVLLPDKIEWQVRHLLEHRLDAVYAGARILHADGSTVPAAITRALAAHRRGALLDLVYTDDTIGLLLQSALITREAFAALVPERKLFKSDDWVMLIRLLERGKVDVVDREAFLYRQHDANTHQRYWQMLPMRVEVIVNVTPERLRLRALSNLLRSLAYYLGSEGKTAAAQRMLAAALALGGSAVAIGRLGASLMKRAILRR